MDEPSSSSSSRATSSTDTAGGSPKKNWVPRPVAAQEVLQLYNDVLRAGRMQLNAKEVRWSTEGDKEQQLRAFCEAFTANLRCMPELARLDDLVLSEAAYWFCKATAIRYYPIDAVLKKVSATNLANYDAREGGVMQDYVAEVRGGLAMRAKVLFRNEDNLLHHDVETGDTSVRGSIASVETEFPLPPDFNFQPEYTLQLRSPKSSGSRLKWPQSPWRDRRSPRVCETFSPDGKLTLSPDGRLCSDYPLCSFSTLLEQGANSQSVQRGKSGYGEEPREGDPSTPTLLRQPASRFRSSSTPASANVEWEKVVAVVRSDCAKDQTNDEDAPVRSGTDGRTYYCGRHFGKDALPGTNGYCGPSDGLQCQSCRRHQLQKWSSERSLAQQQKPRSQIQQPQSPSVESGESRPSLAPAMVSSARNGCFFWRRSRSAMSPRCDSNAAYRHAHTL